MDSAISYRKRSFSRSVPRAGADGESSGLIGSLFASFRGESGGLSGRDEDYHEAADEPWGQDESDLLDEEVLEDASEDEELDHSDRSSVSSERPTSPTSRFIPNVFGNDADPFGDVRHDNYDEASEVPFEDPALSFWTSRVCCSRGQRKKEVKRASGLTNHAGAANKYTYWMKTLSSGSRGTAHGGTVSFYMFYCVCSRSVSQV